MSIYITNNNGVKEVAMRFPVECNNGHPVIIHSELLCPMCEMQILHEKEMEENSTWEDKYNDLNEEKDNLQREYDDLEYKVDLLKAENEDKDTEIERLEKRIKELEVK
jgi:peptidoglycan hydrolase CwlO-like protein